MFTDIGDPATHRFYRFIFELQGIRIQRSAQVWHMGREKKGAVGKYLVFPDVHRISGEFFSIDRKIIPALESCIDPKFDHYFQDWFRIFSEVDEVAPVALHGKREV